MTETPTTIEEVITGTPEVTVPVETPVETQVEAVVPQETPATQAADLLAMIQDNDLKSNPSLQSFKDVDSLAKSYVHAQALLGKKVEDMAPEEIQSLYSKSLGAPESADEYKLPEMPGAEDGFLDWYKETAHDLSLTTNQAEKLANSYTDLFHKSQAQAEAQYTKQMEESMSSLQKDWGSEYDRKLGDAKAAVRNIGGEELVQYLDSSGAGNSVPMIKAFAKMAEDFGEAQMPTTTSDNLGFKMTPEQAKHAITQKKTSSDFMAAYMNPTHPGHDGAVQEIQDMYATAYIDTE